MANHNPNSQWNARLEGPTAIYRLYDAADRLLYAGISLDPDRRYQEHSNNKLWWHLVTRKHVVWATRRSGALEEEARIEREEHPRFSDSRRLGSGWMREPRQRDEALDHAISVVAAALRADIASGLYPAGAMLPTNLKIAERFGVSKAMARSAVRELHNDRLVNYGRACRAVVRAA